METLKYFLYNFISSISKNINLIYEKVHSYSFASKRMSNLSLIGNIFFMLWIYQQLYEFNNSIDKQIIHRIDLQFEPYFLQH